MIRLLGYAILQKITEFRCWTPLLQRRFFIHFQSPRPVGNINQSFCLVDAYGGSDFFIPIARIAAVRNSKRKTTNFGP